MRNPPEPRGGAGTLIAALLIVVGMGAAGYFLFANPISFGSDESDGYVEVQRVVPLTEDQVVGRAQEGVEVGVFAATLEVEKRSRGNAGKGSASPTRADKVEIENIGARGGQPRKSGTPTNWEPGTLRKKALENVPKLSDEEKEIRRLRKLRNEMRAKELKRAQETADENAW